MHSVFSNQLHIYLLLCRSRYVRKPSLKDQLLLFLNFDLHSSDKKSFVAMGLLLEDFYPFHAWCRLVKGHAVKPPSFKGVLC